MEHNEFNMTGVHNFTGNPVADAVIGKLSDAFRSAFLGTPGGKPITKDEFSDYVANFSVYYVYIGLGVFVSSFLQVNDTMFFKELGLYRYFFYNSCNYGNYFPDGLLGMGG